MIRFDIARESRTCETHGQFESVCHDIGVAAMHWTGCPTCQRQRDERFEKERQREQRELFIRRLVESAQIPPRFRGKGFDSFEASTLAQNRALETARDYAERFVTDHRIAGRCLVECGKPGTGKTHLACAIAGAVARMGCSVLYQTAAGLIRKIRATWGTGDDSSVLRELQNLELLIIDEVGLSFGTDAEILQLSEVIDLRYSSMKPTIVISNCKPSELSKYLGERGVDRLRENGGRVVTFDWESRREHDAS